MDLHEDDAFFDMGRRNDQTSRRGMTKSGPINVAVDAMWRDWVLLATNYWLILNKIKDLAHRN
jgi:hypothetical protein